MKPFILTQVLWLVTGLFGLHAASPDLRTVLPRGGQVGTEVELSFTGSRLGDVEEILFYDEGLEVRSLEVIDDKKVKAMVAIASDCPFGEQRLRLRCRSGLTELRTFWVGPYPSEPETEPNNAFAEPQSVGKGITIEGVAENEDVDYYAVELTKGERLALEIEAIRLGGAMFDPYLAVLDERRFEVAKADDTPLLLQDAHLDFVAPKSARYVIQVRESSYVGGGNFRYRLHVGEFPRPVGLWPPGGRPGETVRVQFLHADPSVVESREIVLPEFRTVEPRMHAVYQERDGHSSPSPNRLRVADMPYLEETEPNNSRRQPNVLGGRAAGTLPMGFHGVIREADDEDWFQFEGKKDQKIVLRLFARRLGSPLDGVMNLYQPDGKHLAGNDDFQNHPDSEISAKLPADGSYTFRVRDHLKNGGRDFVYRVEVALAQPSLVVSIPRFERRNSQTRQTVPVPQGNRYATMISAERSEFSGDLSFALPDLPNGVTLMADTMAASINQFPVVFEATPEAQLDGGFYPLEATPVDSNIAVTGGFTQSVELVLGQPNNTPYYMARSPKRLPLSVVEPVPFKVEVETPKAPLVQNGTIDLKVRLMRDEGFEAPVTLRMLWNPPGIGSPRTVRINKGKTEATYRLNANGGAQTNSWQLAILGESDAGQGPIYASSALVPLTVEPPFLTGKIALAAAKQGETAQVVCQLESHKPFQGEAEVQLVGLPAKCTVEPLTITADTKELVFNVATEKDTPRGKHKNLFCRVAIPAESGGTIPHAIASGGVLRIDKPTPPPGGAVPVATKKKEEKQKPLSRLEELRLAAKAAREARATQASND